MSIRAAVVSGTVLSAAAVSAWSFSASLTIGTAPWPRLGRDLPADYAALAAACAGPGSGPGLFALTAVICTGCLLVSGLRARKRARREAARDMRVIRRAAIPLPGGAS